MLFYHKCTAYFYVEVDKFIVICFIEYLAVDNASSQRTSINVTGTIDSATWTQVLEYNNSHQNSSENATPSNSEKCVQQTAEVSTDTLKRSTVFERKSLVRTPIVDNWDPLGALSGALNQETIVQNAKPDEGLGIVFKAGELSSSQKCRSADDLIEISETRPASKLSLSVNQLDETDHTPSHTLSRLQQLKKDEPGSKSVKPVRRKSFVGVMQLAKKAVASSYNGLRNSFKANSAEWINAGVKAPPAIEQTSSSNSLTLKSRE